MNLESWLISIREGRTISTLVEMEWREGRVRQRQGGESDVVAALPYAMEIGLSFFTTKGQGVKGSKVCRGGAPSPPPSTFDPLTPCPFVVKKRVSFPA